MKKLFFLILFSCFSIQAITNLTAWSRDGQVWLVWKRTNPEPFAYDIYYSQSPITNLSDASFAASIFPENCFADRLKRTYDPAATWTIPAETSNSYILSNIERLFVFTPHLETNYYFAVVDYCASNVTPMNTIGPIHADFSGNSANLYIAPAPLGKKEKNALTVKALMPSGNLRFWKVIEPALK